MEPPTSEKFTEASVLLGASYTPGQSGNFWEESDAVSFMMSRSQSDRTESEGFEV